MRILLTNDDGYDSQGIILLKEELQKYGEVIMVAPREVQSAKSCALTIGKALKVEKLDDLNYIVDGTPIDCVIFGLSIFKNVDLIVSGCNNSPNLGVDTIYSATLGACTQAMISKVKAIAFSCASKNDFWQIKKFSSEVLEYILKNKLLSHKYFLNVNFPSSSYKEAKGIKLTKLFYQNIKYSKKLYKNGLFDSKRRMKIDIIDTQFDLGAFNQGWISISPLGRNNFDNRIYSKLIKVVNQQ